MSNPDKLARYNKKLIAIILTAVLAAAAIGLLASVIALIVELSSGGTHVDPGLKIDQQVVQTGDSLTYGRELEVSFHDPEQLDTARGNFLIPVTQVTLETAEEVKMERKTVGFSSGSGGSYRYNSHYGLFNNFVYYNHETGVSKMIFDKRTVITRYIYLKHDSLEVVLFETITNDDNQDNLLNDDDYESLTVFYLNDGELRHYPFPHQTLLGIHPMKKTNRVALTIGLDKNHDIKFNEYKEPQEVTTLDISSRELVPIVPEVMKQEIQRIVDGVNQ